MRKCLQERDKATQAQRFRRSERKARQCRKKRLRVRGENIHGEKIPFDILFPSSITIQNKVGRKLLFSCLRSFKAKIGSRPITLNFSKVVLQYPSGVLFLLAEIDRQKRIFGGSFNVEIILPENEVSRQVFHQVGIAALCGKTPPKETTHYDESVRHWRYATGTMMTEEPGRALERFEGKLSDELRTGIWKGVSEAIINSLHHAYLEPRSDGFREYNETRWWMFSEVRDGKLTVAVCDLGIGIPRSLPLRWDKAKLHSILSRFGVAKPDVAAIQAALEIGATRTGSENRGKGLPQIWHDMKAHEGANILLLSNHGLIGWRQESQIEVTKSFPDSIFGTLVIWTIPLDAPVYRT